MKLLLLFLLVVVVFAVDQKDEVTTHIGYAVDLSVPASQQVFECLRHAGYDYAFVGAYDPSGDGQVYPYAGQNLINAHNAGFGTYAYFTPSLQSSKSPMQQFTEIYNHFHNHNMILTEIWLQVTHPIGWPNNAQGNINFISQILKIASLYKVKVGIYTSWYDWEQITGNWRLEGHPLWYWNTNGIGNEASGSNDFKDFRPFGGFTHKDGFMKQYTQGLVECNGTVFNRNRYVYTLPKVKIGEGVDFD
ncbi:hypothetical protein QR680_010984 [Steinernema hermaphroditum]|uniref:Lysozyme n=1 Tax=Steinernema hermaphroditum TaxID=289476 RepID=A0AA39ITH5_9BILA|nr:hypothetical protein QR680_010984 [Steinernema hermaphroditum]